MDEINLREITGPVDNPHSSDFELEFESDSDKLSPINKAMELNIDGVEELCEACIKSKYIRIVKSKKMTLITKRLEEIHANLWGSHDPASISSKNYVALLLDEFTRKSWIILQRSNDEFFNIFKLWLPRVEVCRDKLNCLQTDDGGEFISTAFQSFCNE